MAYAYPYIQGNRPPWAINYYFISLYSKYQSPYFIYFSTILAPVISSLHKINCKWTRIVAKNHLHVLQQMNEKKSNYVIRPFEMLDKSDFWFLIWGTFESRAISWLEWYIFLYSQQKKSWLFPFKWAQPGLWDQYL